jgi:hypothetical protein
MIRWNPLSYLSRVVGVWFDRSSRRGSRMATYHLHLYSAAQPSPRLLRIEDFLATDEVSAKAEAQTRFERLLKNRRSDQVLLQSFTLYTQGRQLIAQGSFDQRHAGRKLG